jgi:hypothetical protein
MYESFTNIRINMERKFVNSYRFVNSRSTNFLIKIFFDNNRNNFSDTLNLMVFSGLYNFPKSSLEIPSPKSFMT